MMVGRKSNQVRGLLLTHVDVDDLLLLTEDGLREPLQAKLKEMFPVDDWEDDTFDYVGCEYHCTPEETEEITIKQTSYCQSRVDKVTVPTGLPDDAEAIGSVSWLAKMTRPDLQFQVSQAQKRQNKPTVKDLKETNKLVDAERTGAWYSSGCPRRSLRSLPSTTRPAGDTCTATTARPVTTTGWASIPCHPLVMVCDRASRGGPFWSGRVEKQGQATGLSINVAKTIAVPVADIRVVRWVDAEYAAIRDILRSAPPGKEQDLTMLALRLQHRNSEFFGILEFVPGIGVQGQELHERLEAMAPDRLDSFWYQVGEIVAFDALINNLDRVPLLWDNEGNTANLMLREDNGGVAVVGIDQAVTAIVAEGPGRERYAARLRVLAEGVFTGSWKEQAASQVLPSTTRGGTWSISTGMAHVTECFQLCCGATVHWEAFMAGLRFRLNHIADLADDGSLGTALDEATAAADQASLDRPRLQPATAT
eukprot:s2455_g12.t3